MSVVPKLSLTSAVFINLNVMIGTGIFLNTYDLSASAGAVGFLLYPLVGLCMLPLIHVTAKLLSLFPTGGLYAFGSSYHPVLGFLSCWSYFFGKLASCTVMLSVGATMLSQLIPGLQTYSICMISSVILGLFTLLNLQNLKVGLLIQSFFLTAKSIPIVLAIVAGLLCSDLTILSSTQFLWDKLPMNIPLVLYCLAGFETACALGRRIENPAVNGPKAVYYSFSIIMILYGLFQACIYLMTYDALSTMSAYHGVFPVLISKIFSSTRMQHGMIGLINFAIGSSALGGAYGILFSNSWNLFTLAEHHHLIGSTKIIELNRHQTPWIAVLIEAFVCLLFLWCNQNSLLSLRSTAALGIVIAYTVSVSAYIHFVKNHKGFDIIVARAALLTCLLFVASCALNFMKTGLAPLLLFLMILCTGMLMFFYRAYMVKID